MSRTKLPKGWKSYDPLSGAASRPVRCGDCGWIGVAEDLDEIEDLYERVDPGQVMPPGQCPAIGPDGFACGCFADFTDVIVAFRVVPNILEQIEEATR
ncbi:MAG: hypothetical protein AB7L09_02100 [Nitrospira sp.]